MGKKDVHRLSPESMIDPILLGISSHENDYRLSWAINENLGFHFAKTENYNSYNHRLKENQEFSAYGFKEDESSNLYRLIANRCENGFLLDELKNIDYLLLIYPAEPNFKPTDLMAGIRSIPFVSAIFEIKINSLKNRKRIV